MRTVFLARCQRAAYEPDAVSEPAPELPSGKAAGAPEVLLRRLMANAGMDWRRYGTGLWNPLSDLIRPGDKVVIKPNWVYHQNRSGGGMECLITHTSVLAAILKYTIPASPSLIVIGDAPIQSCDFQQLCHKAGAGELLTKIAPQVGIAIRDFRAARRCGEGFAAESIRSERPTNAYVEFDLGSASALEPITRPRTEFRVTMYDPEAMKKTHAPGRHRYLVAREVVAADVVISVPKLKTHRKAGITGSLKNVVGINGLKDYLPHHRKGSMESGGDCYARSSTFKSFAESCVDAGNRCHRRPRLAAALGGAARLLARLDAASGGDRNLEGAWYGNDTVWRMVLDLQRILTFGRPDGTIANSPQRRVIHITDGIIAGQGEGPLYPSPVHLGVMTMAADAAAAEWVHALLMGFDPHKIPLVRNAVHASALRGDASRISICWDGTRLMCDQLSERHWPAFQPPAGWRGHCELQEAWLRGIQPC